MGTKAEVAAAVSGPIVRGDQTVEITDPTLYKTIKIDGLQAGDALNLLRQNYAGDGYEPVTMLGRHIQLNAGNRTATPVEIGIYSLEGYVTGPVKVWTEEMA